MRTQEEKDFQIKGLENMKAELPEFSFFGDNNYKAIDAVISMLKGEKTYEDFENAESYVESEAYQCESWLQGFHQENLFE